MSESTLSLDARPVVFLFADPDGLSVSLTELLLGNFSRVVILSDKKGDWDKSLEHLTKGLGVHITGLDEKPTLKPDYILFVDTEVTNATVTKSKIRLATETAREDLVKCILVLPLQNATGGQREVVNYAKDQLTKNRDYVGIVYAGEQLGPRIELGGKGVLAKILTDTFSGNVYLPKKDIKLGLVHVSDLARTIVRSLFSFGGTGVQISITSRPTSLKNIVGAIRELRTETAVSYKEGLYEFERVENVEVVYKSINLKKDLKETLDWLDSHIPKQNKEPVVKKKKTAIIIKKPKSPKINIPSDMLLKTIRKIKPPKIPRINSKRWIYSGLILLLVLLSPFVLMGISVAGLVTSFLQAEKGNFNAASKLVSISTTLNNASFAELNNFRKIPLIGGVFETGTELSYLMSQSTNVTQKGIYIAQLSNDLFKKILGDEDYDIYDHASKISIELDATYRDASFLEGEIRSSSPFTKRLFSRFVTFNLNKVRQKMYLSKRVVDELPKLLGGVEPQKYLVLFQNNMELRPTGGFIGSFALVTASGGRLVDIQVRDVYSADGQLKGHIAPPAPIKDYLGEANWFLRDSNWDPDFPTSAERAEWFLDKEIELSVDGVIGIDLEVLRSFIEQTGSIYVSDFDRELTEENFYEVIQYETEKEFFPGSYNKTNFLTALTQEMLLQTTRLSQGSNLGTAKAFYNGLEERHVQVFVHNKAAQRAVSELGWDGAVSEINCSGNCYPDYFGIVEANLGVNKTNYSIKRDAAFSVEIVGGVIKRRLALRFENTGSQLAGLTGTYKVYVRLIVPQDSDFLDAEVVAYDSRDVKSLEVESVRGHKEGGILISVSPGTSKTINFGWETLENIDFFEKGEYRLYWRKQAGTLSDPVSIEISLPEAMKISSEPEATLTQGKKARYNTFLARDFYSRIFW